MAKPAEMRGLLVMGQPQPGSTFSHSTDDLEGCRVPQERTYFYTRAVPVSVALPPLPESSLTSRVRYPHFSTQIILFRCLRAHTHTPKSPSLSEVGKLRARYARSPHNPHCVGVCGCPGGYLGNVYTAFLDLIVQSAL